MSATSSVSTATSSVSSQFERALPFFAAIALILSIAALARAFVDRGFPSGHDATAHITYTFLFDRALAQGQFPVRWVEWVRNGESQPLFNFYPPGLYYAIEAIHLAVPRLSTAFKASVVIVWWLGALFTFLWLRPLGWIAAGSAAAIFAWSPYVLVDVFVRAAYPELAAMSLAPGLLWAVDRLIGRARAVDGLLVAGFVGAMLTTHLLSSLIFAPVIAAYALSRLLPGAIPGGAEAPPLRAGVIPGGAEAPLLPERARRGGASAPPVVLLIVSVTLGVGLASFYLLPSMAELEHVAIGRMTSGYSDYRQHFVAPAQWFSTTWGYGGSVPGHADGMPLQIGIVQWLVLGAAVVQIAVTRRWSRPTIFWLAVVACAMFLMTEHSAFLWRATPALPFLQFPWRYFMVVSLGTAALAAYAMALVPYRALQALLAMALVVSQFQLSHDHVKPLHYFPRNTLNIDSARWPEMEAVGAGAFIERGFTPTAVRHEAPAGIGRWTIIDGSADVRERHIADDAMELDVSTGTGVRLRLNSHYFPGWTVRIDGAPAEVAIDPAYGLMEITLASGVHRVEARFENTRVRSIANAISLASLFVAGVMLVEQVRSQKSNVKRQKQ